MTAVTVLPVASEALTGDQRQEALARLARDTDWQTHQNVMCVLAMYAHRSLSPDRRAALFGEYCDCMERSTALLAGVADWADEMPELRCDDPQNWAAYALEDRANEALFALVHGEVSR